MIPKFRAWDKHNKKMFTNEELIIWNDNVYANDRRKLSVDKLKGWSISDKFLMQSTGLADKNGVEIFEGDVVKQEMLIPTSGIEEITGVVKMLEGAWMIVNDKEEIACHLWREGAEMKISGNIYKNHELTEAINDPK